MDAREAFLDDPAAHGALVHAEIPSHLAQGQEPPTKQQGLLERCGRPSPLRLVSITPLSHHSQSSSWSLARCFL